MTSTAADDARRRLADLIGGYRATQMIGVAARLGLPDRLAGSGRSASDLAVSTGCHPDALRRLLQGLVNIGILTEDVAGTFHLTATGDLLRTDVPGSQRAWAILEGSTSYRAWGDLDHSVTTGRTAFEHTFGLPFFQYLSAHAEA